jgi:sulfate transport system permease protein
MRSKLSLRLVALFYLAVVLVGPVVMVFYRAFETGLGDFWRAISDAQAAHALWLTVLIALVAVPLNTVFGVALSLAIVRRRFPGKGLVNAFVDLPLALSPVVAGLALLLLYGRQGWLGPWFLDHGIQVVYALPAMVLATIFVSLPFVVREVVPVLREIGDEQEQATSTLGANGWQTFRRITLPAIRWGVAYGVVLTAARSLGEFGAVNVVSGRIQGKTETATLYIDAAYLDFNQKGAYAVSVVLALISVVILVAMSIFKPKEETA